MPQYGKSLIIGLGALLTLAMALIGYQAHALQRMAQLEPAVVATVDLLAVFDAIEERNTAAQEINAQLDALVEEKTRREQTIAALEADMNDFATGTPQFREAQQKYMYEVLKFDGWSKFATRKMDILNAEAIQKLYLSVKQHAQDLAERNGYDLVLVDDELAEFIPGTEADVMRQISARRMLYSTQVIDITDELIAEMNAAGTG